MRLEQARAIVDFVVGGVAVFDHGARIGAVGVSGLPGEVDEALATRAIQAAGLTA